MELYQHSGAKLPLESRACLLLTLLATMKMKPCRLVEQVLDGLEPGQDFNFLPKI